ncbi:MAG: LamG domain-containing protein [Desulfobacterales bacterium]|nr:LamG domain-containing protein [Desulfobacterales bacterium]
MAEIQAVLEKSKRIGGDDESLDGIPGDQRGTDSKGINIALQVGDICRIIESGVLRYFQYVDYSGDADGVNYIRPVVNPDLTKAWKLVDSISISKFTEASTFNENATFEKDLNVTGALNVPNGISTKLNELYLNGSIVSVDIDRTIDPTEQVREYVLQESATANRTFTFSTLSESDDGKIFNFNSESDYDLTIKPNAEVSIWKSVKGFGIRCTGGGTCSLRYDHVRLKLILVSSTGKWMVEELKIYMPGIKTSGSITDEKVYNQGSFSGVQLAKQSHSNSGFLDFHSYYLGNGDYIEFPYSTNYQLFADKTSVITMGVWFYFTGHNYAQELIAVFESADKRYFAEFNYENKFMFYMKNGSESFYTQTTQTFPKNNWYYVNVVKKMDEIGAYINGTQFFYNNSWTDVVFNSSLLIGLQQKSDTTWSLNGNIKDFFICHQNIFNAAPNSGNNDSIEVPKNYLNLTTQ